MAAVDIYTIPYCPYCADAKELLSSKGVSFHEIDATANRDIRKQMLERANGHSTYPQIFIGATHVGGCDDLYALEAAGKLDRAAGRSQGTIAMSAATPSTFKVGLVQMRSGLDPHANLTALLAAIDEAKRRGADYVQTPEMTNILALKREHLFASIVVEEHDPTLATLRELAQKLSIYIHIGSLAIKVSQDKAANRAFVIDRNGDIAARYDKIHMFDVDLAGGESYRESNNYRSGDLAVAADLPWGRLGVTICYDLRFPALYRALAEAGASFLAIPAAFTKQTGEAHWHVLMRARAIENSCYVFAAAQGGRHENGRDTFGHSLVVDPWGKIVAEGGTEPGVIIAEIDPAAVAAARGKVPSLRHGRRFELVEPLAEPTYLHAVRGAS